MLVLDEVHTNHHWRAAETAHYSCAPATFQQWAQHCGSSRDASQSTQPSHQQGLLLLWCRPSTDNHKKKNQQQNTQTKKKDQKKNPKTNQPNKKTQPKNTNPAESPKSAWIYSFRALIQVMNRLWTWLASKKCQRLYSGEQQSSNTECLVQ